MGSRPRIEEFLRLEVAVDNLEKLPLLPGERRGESQGVWYRATELEGEGLVGVNFVIYCAITYHYGIAVQFNKDPQVLLPKSNDPE